jgi:hypothetical protein
MTHLWSRGKAANGGSLAPLGSLTLAAFRTDPFHSAAVKDNRIQLAE